ncbi:MAG: SPOR domain-containing protein, partial [Sphingomonas sp.]
SPVAKVLAKGDFYVQLGAYENAAVAKDAWGRMARRFAGHTPSGMNFAANGANFYRLSIGGFTRHDADAVCHGYRARGGRCFVRTAAGDQMAAWNASGNKLASR